MGYLLKANTLCFPATDKTSRVTFSSRREEIETDYIEFPIGVFCLVFIRHCLISFGFYTLGV